MTMNGHIDGMLELGWLRALRLGEPPAHVGLLTMLDAYYGLKNPQRYDYKGSILFNSKLEMRLNEHGVGPIFGGRWS